MPKASKNKYYAVKLGREGPKIYNTWDECKTNVSRYPGAVHKSFTSRKQAEDWLKEPIPVPLGSLSDKLLSEELLSNGPTNQATRMLNTSSDTPVREDILTKELPDGPSSSGSSQRVVLSPEQIKILQMVREGRNVFFTGSAGTGKSVLLREIIKTLGDGPSSTFGITASTGIASVNIGGTTLHSWAGIGLGQEPVKTLAGKILGQPKLVNVRDRWQTAKTLIIDEISMIDGILFDKLEEIARILRMSSAPFGGIQLILSGDFCQLPPVPDRRDGVQLSPRFAFDAKTWKQCVGAPIMLTKVFRQKDQAFVDMLNAMRFGQMNTRAIEEFKTLTHPVAYNDGIGPTQLYPTRKEVDNANETRLRQLPGNPHTYQSMDLPGYDSKGERVSQSTMERLLDRLIASKMISLKVGAQVMLIKNLVQGSLVNGSVGQVIAFSTSREAQKNHTEIAQVDNAQDQRIAQTILNRAAENERVWPIVRFTNGRDMLIVPVEFTVNNAEGGTEASREQVPLILAWALSIHKSQGQTLERVKIDLGRIFEKGQAYVALSRATSMKTLEVHNFQPTKVMAHPRVLAWHREFEQDNMLHLDDDLGDEMDNDEAMMSYYDD